MHGFFLPNPLVFETNFMFQRGSPSAPKNSLEFSPCPTRRLRPCSVATGFSHAVRLTNLKYVATSPFWLAGWVTRRPAGPGWPNGWLAVGDLALAGPASGPGTATDWPGGQLASWPVTRWPTGWFPAALQEHPIRGFSKDASAPRHAKWVLLRFYRK